MSSISLPHALILVSILVKLNTEPIFAVVFPITDIARSLLPLFSLNASVLLPLLLLYHYSQIHCSGFIMSRIKLPWPNRHFYEHRSSELFSHF
jgi:hypothetical protein